MAGERKMHVLFDKEIRDMLENYCGVRMPFKHFIQGIIKRYIETYPVFLDPYNPSFNILQKAQVANGETFESLESIATTLNSMKDYLELKIKESEKSLRNDIETNFDQIKRCRQDIQSLKL